MAVEGGEKDFVATNEEIRHVKENQSHTTDGQDLPKNEGYCGVVVSTKDRDSVQQLDRSPQTNEKSLQTQEQVCVG